MVLSVFLLWDRLPTVILSGGHMTPLHVCGGIQESISEYWWDRGTGDQGVYKQRSHTPRITSDFALVRNSCILLAVIL